MSRTIIDYYLSPVSPWNYLASVRFRHLAERHKAGIRLFVMDLGLVFPETGGLPLPKRAPQRQAYRLQELSRFSRYLDVPLVLQPASFPPSSGLGNLVVMAAREGGGTDRALQVSEILFSQLWAEDRDIGSPAVVTSALDNAGLPGAQLVADARANEDRYLQLIADDSRRAVDANIFGAPSFVVDDQVFWGQDRLDLLDWYLTSRARE